MGAWSRRWALVAAACGLLAAFPAGAADPDPYAGLPFAAFEVYEAMLQFAQEANFTRLARALQYARPLVRGLGRDACGESLEARLDGALARRDAAAAREAVRAVVEADLHRQLSIAQLAAPGDAREEPLQMAFAFYQLLAPRLAPADRAADERVRRAFRELRQAADPSGPAARIEAAVLSPVPRCAAPPRSPP